MNLCLTYVRNEDVDGDRAGSVKVRIVDPRIWSGRLGLSGAEQLAAPRGHSGVGDERVVVLWVWRDATRIASR
jgi:hypothetical protein